MRPRRACCPLPGAALLAAAGLFSGPLPDVVITEILKDAPGPESQMPGGLSHEFVELVNIGLRPLTLEHLHLSDGADADPVVALVDVIPGHERCRYGVDTLHPGECALILDPDYPRAVREYPYSRFAIADNTVLWTIAGDSDLGNGLANNDGVMLYRGTPSALHELVAIAVDEDVDVVVRGGKMILSQEGADGVSVVLTSFLSGWPRYESCPGGTSPGVWEGAQSGWWVEVALGEELAGSIPCTVAVLRIGEPIAPSTRFVCRTSSPSGAVSQPHLTPQPVQDPRVRRFVVDVGAGELRHAFVILHEGEEVIFGIDVSSRWVERGSVAINELYPRAQDNRPEWVELYTPSSVPVNLKGWTLERPDRSEQVSLTDLFIAANGYMILTPDSARFRKSWPGVGPVHQMPRWPTLNNYRDTLTLRAATGVAIDAVCYASDWFTLWNYESIERLSLEGAGCDTRVWALSERPTPGMPNRSVQRYSAPRPTLHVGPHPFTPNGDGRDDLLAIRLELAGGGGSSEVTIYGFDGSVYRRLKAQSQVIYWDGKRTGGDDAPAGPFFVVVQGSDARGRSFTLRSGGVLWR